MRVHMLKPKQANVGWAKVMPALSGGDFQKPMIEKYADFYQTSMVVYGVIIFINSWNTPTRLRRKELLALVS